MPRQPISPKPKKLKTSQNPAGPVDKPKGRSQPPGLSDDTRVVWSEEHNLDDGG